jgi:hypothetical protein
MARRSVFRGTRLLIASLVVLGFASGASLGAQPGGGSGPGPKIAAQAKQRLNRIRAAIATHRLHAQNLMRIPDVVGSAIGVAPDGEPVIRVFTARHQVLGIPNALDGLTVRPEVSGRVYALRGATCNTSGDEKCTNAERWPLPVPIGVSVGHPAITAGTIGARVTKEGNVFVLSNNHVLAAINQGLLGDFVLQPGSFDGGTSPGDAIASLTDFEPLKFCTVYFIWIICQQTNTIDAAIAQSMEAELGFATPGGEYGSVPGYGAPSPALHPAYGNPGIGDENLAQLLGIQVQKYGRTTGLTVGTLDAINATVDVCYDSSCLSVARFVDQLVISPGTFSGGGDSGSLIVDSGKHPVGLLFAGSSTNTIANRIDLVLNRFGVRIDEGSLPPAIDVAVTGINAPPSVAAGSETTITVTVANLGQQQAINASVVLTDAGVSDIGTDSIPILDAGASTTIDFPWTPATAGAHTLQASAQLTGDENTANDRYTTNVNVVVAGPGTPQLQLRRVLAYTDRWTTVQLDYDYGNKMVVACSPNYDLSAPGPAIVRVTNASGSSFQVGLGRPWYGAYEFDHFSAMVHCMVVREGVYSVAEHGVKMEAVTLPNFISSDHAGAWFGQSRPYQNPAGYSVPVVLGQVASPDTGLPPSYCTPICQQDWSVFWSRGTAVTNPPSSGALYVGRHTGEDRSDRPPETLMYVVIQGGTGSIEGRGYVAARGADTVRGMTNRPPYTYSLSGLASASTAIVSQAGMDGADGGWPVLYGPAAVSATQLRLAIDEDWYLYSERNHTTEQLGYVVFE